MICPPKAVSFGQFINPYRLVFLHMKYGNILENKVPHTHLPSYEGWFKVSMMFSEMYFLSYFLSDIISISGKSQWLGTPAFEVVGFSASRVKWIPACSNIL